VFWVIQAVAKLAEPPTSDPKTAAIALTIVASIAVSASPVELRQVSTGENFRKVQRTNGCEWLVQLIIKKIKNRLGGTGLFKHEGAYIGIYQSVHRLPS